MEWNESINNLDVEMDGCMPEKEKLFLSGGYYIKPFKYHKILEEILIELFTTSRACDEAGSEGGSTLLFILYFISTFELVNATARRCKERFKISPMIHYEQDNSALLKE